MQPLDETILQFYKNNPEMLATRKLIFAECVENHIKKQRPIVNTGNLSELKNQGAYLSECFRMEDLPFNQVEMDFFNRWLKRFDVMFSYGMLPQIEDVKAQKIK